tara:strand:+ start:1139 stop:1552 length:414 start_codon:yes stop_codon:yes gene_type:complete
MNLDSLFNLFPPKDVIENNDVHIDFTESPTYYLGMWKKIILNHINFNKKILQFFKKTNDEFDIQDVAEAGTHVVFNRAWYYLKSIDIKNDDHIKSIKDYKDDYLETSLELGIKHFQKIEEYEKCAHILKVLKTSQKF